MRNRVLVVVLLVGVSTLTLSLIRGQDRGSSTPAATGSSDAKTPPPAVAQPVAAAPLAPARDLSHLTGLSQQMLQTAQRGADWLYRMNSVKGRFTPGLRPALNQVAESDSFFRQAGATAALARAARFCGEDRYAARATQAVLALLDETSLDPNDKTTRVVTLPPAAVNRLGATGAIVLAIQELPNPQKDVLEWSEQLCSSLRKMVRPDGALGWDDGSGKLLSNDEGIPHYPGIALQGLLLSYRRQPAAWKLEVARKALPVYREWWRKNKDIDFATSMTKGFTQAYLLTKEKPFADFVGELGDWLCELQYVQIDPRRALWFGGFRTVSSGRATDTQPTAAGACCAEAIVAACRVAAESGDLDHHKRFAEAVERALQFLSTLQYTDGRTTHFAPWYRPHVSGAFHLGHNDGNLRLEDTQHAVSALLGYLEYVVR